MDQVAIIKQMIQSLSQEQQVELVNLLINQNTKNNNYNQETSQTSNFTSIVINHSPGLLPDRPSCPHCKSPNVKKNGHKNGRQRYLCKECKHTFAITNNTILYRSQKSVET